jgi:hypothetical protein
VPEPARHGLSRLGLERPDVGVEALLERLEQLVGLPTGAVLARNDAPREQVVPEAVGEPVAAGLAERLLGRRRVIHRVTRPVVERHERAVGPVEPLDAEFDAMNGGEFGLRQARILRVPC